jgi:hypothetical protein
MYGAQNNIGAGAIPLWMTDGVQIANIYEWPEEPIGSTLVGRTVSLIYSTTLAELIYSTDGQSWRVVGSGSGAAVDADARLAIGWPWTQADSIKEIIGDWAGSIYATVDIVTAFNELGTGLSSTNTRLNGISQSQIGFPYTNPNTLDTRVTALENGPVVDSAARTAIGWPYVNPSNISTRLTAFDASTLKLNTVTGAVAYTNSQSLDTRVTALENAPAGSVRIYRQTFTITSSSPNPLLINVNHNLGNEAVSVQLWDLTDHIAANVPASPGFLIRNSTANSFQFDFNGTVINPVTYTIVVVG